MKKILFSLLMLCCMTVAWAQEDGFVDVATTIQLWNAIKDNPRAKVRLTADFALSDINKDYELYCNGNTFYGTIDGNGHTIKGDPVTSVRARTYMFCNCSGATIKNLTFKGIRVNSQKNPNQAIITAKAMNHCVFENITFDNVHTFSDYDNAAAAAGWAQDCTFTNITVKNSDFTTDATQSGAVVAHAINCTFTNIKVENCESTSDDGKSGGVAGRADDCTFNDIEVLGTFIKTNSNYGGGVVGYSEGTQFTNCIVDDQSCVCVDGCDFPNEGRAGGIVGYGKKCNIYNCINSALITADEEDAGGIIGYGAGMDIVGCLNTGMVISIGMNDVKGGFYNKYKTKTGMTCVIKTFQGKEYVIRKYDGDYKSDLYFGGIIGDAHSVNVSKCVNFGSVYSGSSYIGGIAGYVLKGTISDCLSDFSGDEDICGICLFDSSTTSTGGGSDNVGNPHKHETTIHEVSIDNCLNMTIYKDFKPNLSGWIGFSGGNNYSLTTSTEANLTKYITKTTVDELASGKICHLLGENWQQIIATDSHPVPGSEGLRYARAFSKEQEYGTACVPYALKSDDNISYYTFAEASEGSDIQLKFEYADEVDPGTPVLFRVAKGTKEVRFNNAGAEFLDNPITTSYPVWNMLGTFEQKVFDGEVAKSIYYLSGGEIKNAKKTTIAPYKAYIQGPSFEHLTSSGANIRIVVEDEDGETTAISLINENNNENFGGKTYSLMGTEVNDSYRGIVIRNGKKYINR